MVFFGGILLTSTILFALPPPNPTMSPEEVELDTTKTGTPMDNFPDEQRATFCGVENAKSNSYVTEYKIPTVCTQPLAIKVAPDGNVWFIETNTGSITKFDPVSEQFTEFENSFWPEQGRTMSWGMDYSPDGSLWYTDGTYDSIWKFNTITETYDGIPYPVSETGSLPQKLEIDGSNVFVNDFTGGKITIFDLVQNMDDVTYMSILNPIPDGFTGDFAIDSENNLWYTNWVVDSTGFLVKLDLADYQNEVSDDDTETTLENYIHVFDFPDDLNTANGLSADSNGNIWIADTSSSYFFKFDSLTEEFTKYVTSTPSKPNYGNYSGVIKTPISRPYWTSIDSNNLIFNEQTSNSIGIFNIEKESLIEYSIPSRNPGWADCAFIDSTTGEQTRNNFCGVAQVFGFDIAGDKIWFSEWAENKIGVIDTSKSLPISVDVDTNVISLKKGEKSTFNLTLTYSNLLGFTQDEIEIISSNTAPYQSFPYISTSVERNEGQSNQETVQITVFANEKSLPGEYKLLIGWQTDEIAVSKYIDVVIES